LLQQDSQDFQDLQDRRESCKSW